MPYISVLVLRPNVDDDDPPLLRGVPDEVVPNVGVFRLFSALWYLWHPGCPQWSGTSTLLSSK